MERLCLSCGRLRPAGHSGRFCAAGIGLLPAHGKNPPERGRLRGAGVLGGMLLSVGQGVQERSDGYLYGRFPDFERHVPGIRQPGPGRHERPQDFVRGGRQRGLRGEAGERSPGRHPRGLLWKILARDSALFKTPASFL